MNAQVRTATTADLAKLREFEQGVISAERPFDEWLAEGKISYYNIEELISSPQVEMVVAELDGELVACGYARIEESKPYFRHSRHAYLGLMYVLPEQRGKGINKLVLDALTKWVKSQGLSEMRLEVYYDNAPAIQAYEKFGFKKAMIEMRMNLDD